MRGDVHHRYRSNCEVQRELIEGIRGSRRSFSIPLCFLVRNFSTLVPGFE